MQNNPLDPRAVEATSPTLSAPAARGELERRLAVLERALASTRGWVPGDIKATAKAAADPGWLACDGSTYNRDDYPDLFAALGGASSPYGLPSASTFQVPDLRGRVPVGVDGSAGRLSSNDALGNAGGVESVALTPAQTAIRNHTHGGTTGNSNQSLDHNHAASVGTVNGANNGAGVAYNLYTPPLVATATGNANLTAHTHTFTTGNPTGGEANGSAHTNLQPYQVVNFVIKA